MRIRRLVTIIALARSCDRADKTGHEVIIVPRWLAPEVKKMMFERTMDRAKERWGNHVGSVPVEEWQRAVLRKLRNDP